MDSGPVPVPCNPIQREWEELARAPSLAVLVDLDGTVIPFAPTLEEAVLDDEAAALLRRLVEADVQVVVVSGRPRAAIDPLLKQVPRSWWAAEHGAWRYRDRAWTPPGRGVDLDEIEQRLRRVAADFDGARFERKTLSLCLHWRQVDERDRAALVAAAELTVEEWLETRPDLERLDGAMLLEVRHRSANKGAAVRWAREHLPAEVRLIAFGDDITDEDTFAALSPRDAAVGVGPVALQRARAGWWVPDTQTVRRTLAWLSETRLLRSPPATVPVRELAHERDDARTRAHDLLVISNRTPAAIGTRERPVGGLVSALEPTMVQTRGVWLGWSGHEREAGLVLNPDAGSSARAVFDYPEGWREKFYDGFCNQSLWPLLHCFPGRVRYRDDEWIAYLVANEAYARLATSLVSPDTPVWVHDYHLMLVGSALRKLGHRGPIGFFLHVPFPPRDLWETLPWSAEMMSAMMSFDLVGMHTQRWVDNFVHAAISGVPGCALVDGALVRRETRTEVVVAPIGSDSAYFATPATGETDDVEGLRANLGGRKLLLGVDRLDYSKGIPERLEGFRRLLQLHPGWRRKVSFVQISVPSRADVPEYAELRRRVEELVGRINGEMGEADWVPVRYLYRSYDPSVLARLYRLADVAVVTPLRDGMNLVAKEFVAAQDPAAPGALVLSRFAGAAEELDAAILTNPFHADGLAEDLNRALRMPNEERVARHARMLAVARRSTATSWAESFLARLEATR